MALDPYTNKGLNVNQCVPCAALSEEQWTHLRDNFAKRSAYRSRTGSRENLFEEFDTDESVFTGENLSRVDDTGSTAPVTGISPLKSLPAPLPGSSQDIPATSVTSGSGPVISPHGESSAFFKAPAIYMPQTVTQDTLPPPHPHTQGGQSVIDRMASLSFLQPQRTSSLMIPQTPRTQMIQSHLEQQNFELMRDLQQKNQEQMRNISAQLQTGHQAFLKQSMEQMFNHMAPPQTAPPPQASSAPHIVSITPVSALPQAAKMEEPMDSAPSQPPPEVRKGLSGVKGSSAIASQSTQWLQTSRCPLLPLPPNLRNNLQLLHLQGFNHLFKPWNKRNTALTPLLLLLQPPDQKNHLTQGNRRPFLTYPSENWSRRLESSFPFPTQQQKRITNWARH